MIAIGTFLRAKRVHHLYRYQVAVRRIAGAAGRGNVKGVQLRGEPSVTTRRSPARPVEGVDQAIGVRDEPVVLLRERAAPPGEGVVLRDEVRAPGADLAPKIGELGVEPADFRVHGPQPRRGGAGAAARGGAPPPRAPAPPPGGPRHSASIAFSRSAQDTAVRVASRRAFIAFA